mmetsp:Transcript_22090/g.44351  ORF Transcript_22090/g.44351 Transcript_22090/m.44351 type:complete len:362 (-) Transcript_22090:252-1337(-)
MMKLPIGQQMMMNLPIDQQMVMNLPIDQTGEAGVLLTLGPMEVETGALPTADLMTAGALLMALLTADPTEAGVPLTMIVLTDGNLMDRLPGRMTAGAEREVKVGANQLKQKLRNHIHDPYDGFLNRVAIGCHMDGILPVGEQMTLAGAASGGETTVHPKTDSSGIDQCMVRARLLSQSPQRRKEAAGVVMSRCRTVMMNRMIGGSPLLRRIILFQEECGLIQLGKLARDQTPRAAPPLLRRTTKLPTSLAYQVLNRLVVTSQAVAVSPSRINLKTGIIPVSRLEKDMAKRTAQEKVATKYLTITLQQSRLKVPNHQNPITLQQSRLKVPNHQKAQPGKLTRRHPLPRMVTRKKYHWKITTR